MATKVSKEVSAKSAAQTLSETLGQHTETVRDLDGMPCKVARVALVQVGDQITAVAVGHYALKRIDQEVITGLANDAHTLVAYS